MPDKSLDSPRGAILAPAVASTLVAIAMNVLNQKYGTFIPDWCSLLVVYAAAICWLYAGWHSKRGQRLRALLYTKPRMLAVLITFGAIVGGLAGAGLWLTNRNEQRMKAAAAAKEAAAKTEAVPAPPAPEKPETKPQDVRFLLTPGNHPTPKGPPCGGDSETPLQIPDGVIAVFVGNSVVFTNRNGAHLISVDGEPILSFGRTTGGMSLTGLIRARPTIPEVGKITGNLITLNPDYCEVVPSDSSHFVVVSKLDDTVLLSVWYVNESAMVISGEFYGKDSGPFWIRDGSPIDLGRYRMMDEHCSENHDGPLVPFSGL